MPEETNDVKQELQKTLFYIFFLTIASFAYAQKRASGKIVDAKNNKEVSKVDIFINDNTAPSLTTTSGSFTVQSDSIIQRLKFVRKNYTTETLDITPDNAENIFVQLSQAKVSNIQEVVIQAGKPKYKSKKENPAYAIMQKVWAQKEITDWKNLTPIHTKNMKRLNLTLII